MSTNIAATTVLQNKSNKKNYNIAKKNQDIFLNITEADQLKLISSIEFNTKIVEYTILARIKHLEPKYGEIWYVDLGVNVGDEMEKNRPCVIISPDEYNTASSLVSLVPITNSEAKYKSHFELNNETVNSYWEEEVTGTVKVEQITTKSQGRLISPVGMLTQKGIEILNDCLSEFLSFSNSKKDISSNEKVCEVVEELKENLEVVEALYEEYD